ncbi:hypothetical protein EZS27_041975, partial [termite gut metagenome]
KTICFSKNETVHDNVIGMYIERYYYKNGTYGNNIFSRFMTLPYFQSLGEYRTLLEQFNVTAEEIKGEHDGKPYNGILYCVTDEKGNKLGRPLKSSLFGKEVGYDALQKHYELSKAAVEKKRCGNPCVQSLRRRCRKQAAEKGSND